jgi:hypothetical protein
MSAFYYLSILSPVLPIVFFILFKPGKSLKVLWVVFFYVIFSFSIDSFRFLSKQDPPYSFILLFTLCDYTFVFFIMWLLLESRMIKIILSAISIFFVLYIALLFLRAHPASYPTISPVESIIVLIFCILYLFEQLNKPEELFVYSTPGFWIILAFLVYASGTLFLYIFRIINFQEVEKWWVINNVCNIILNALFALSFLINYTSLKSKNPSKEIPRFDN